MPTLDPRLPVTGFSGVLGAGMDEAAIREVVDACLSGTPDAARFGPAHWARLPGSFPAWSPETGA